jgi:hypothetical protein
MSAVEILKDQFNQRLQLVDKRPGISQLMVPLFHEDGDMVDIFLEGLGGDRVRICDYGMTLMRLSYEYEVDTPNKQRILAKILSENGLKEEDGNLYIEAPPDQLYPAVMQFAQAVAKVGSMRNFKREIIASLFYELLEEFTMTQLQDFRPQKAFLPLPDRDDLEVDYSFPINGTSLYLFGVKDASKARLTTISCLEFIRHKLPFRSIVVHEDFDALPRKDRSRLTSACDKQFTSLDDFRSGARQFLEREKVH